MTTEQAKDLMNKKILVSVTTRQPYETYIINVSRNGEYVKLGSGIGWGIGGWHDISEVKLLDVLE